MVKQNKKKRSKASSSERQTRMNAKEKTEAKKTQEDLHSQDNRNS
jgi:hypothetical protein